MRAKGASWVVLAAALLPALCVQASAYEPIYVLFSYHLDPLGPNAQVAEANYPAHREAVQWATALSLSTGLKLSAGCTGNYAEACLINGHQADFATFMPGGHNALGTHLHAHRKLPNSLPYEWQEVPPEQQTPPTVAEIFADQITYVNQMFTALGSAPTDNEFLHGTHAQSTGIMDDLYRLGGVPNGTYPNVFRVLGGARGLYHPYRGDAEGSGENLSGFYVHEPIVSGIAGRDELHGPEGMLYGTLPYLKKDFMLEYLEWRFAQSRGLPERIWVFGWGSHPYQTTPTYLGTDGVPVRQTIQSIVAWLNENFIEQTSAEGNVIARYATYLEVHDRFLQWETDHPGESSIDGDPATGPNHQLVATANLLATSFYDAEIAGNVTVEVHRFGDREDGTVRYVAWTDLPPQTLDLSGELPGVVLVTDYLGGVSVSDSTAISVGGDPLVIVAWTAADFDGDGDVDLDDFGSFAACYNGSDRPPAPTCPPGVDADLDTDGDVDLDDFAIFAANYTGTH